MPPARFSKDGTACLETSQAVVVLSDDGAGSDGALAAARALRSWGASTMIVAASSERGSSGTSIRPESPQGESDRFTTSETDEGIRVVVVDAPPARAALMVASGAFGLAPTVAVSGVNWGPNVGTTAIHSGTVGAAYAYANLGLRSAAVSLDDVYSVDERDPGELRWEAASQVLCCAARLLLHAEPGTLLNINVPNWPPRVIAGVRHSRLTLVSAHAAMTPPPHPRPIDRSPRTESITDVELLAQGIISVTPLPTFAYPSPLLDIDWGAKLGAALRASSFFSDVAP